VPKLVHTTLPEVWVVSRGRWEHSDTLKNIRDSYVKVNLAVHTEEKDKYKALASEYKCNLVHFNYTSINDKRHKIAQRAGPKLIMLDDDLEFYRRKQPGHWALRVTLENELRVLLERIGKALDTYAHVGVSGREGNNRMPEPHVENTRYMRLLAYRTEEYLACTHPLVNFVEDFDANLQMLRKGMPSLVITDWAQGQKGTQTPGGCSLARTHARQEESVKALAARHPGFVRLREKHNKSGGEFGHRTESTIYWKKAFESAG